MDIDTIFICKSRCGHAQMADVHQMNRVSWPPCCGGKFASQKVDFMFGGDGKADLSRHEKDHVSMYLD